MAFLISIAVGAAALALLATKSDYHERIIIYRNRTVCIGKVPPLEVAQLN
jgi:hypothetical protein